MVAKFQTPVPPSQSIVLTQANAQSLLKALIDLGVGTYSGQATNVLPLSSLQSGVLDELNLAAKLAAITGTYLLSPLDQDFLSDLQKSGGTASPSDPLVDVTLSPETKALFEQGGWVLFYNAYQYAEPNVESGSVKGVIQLSAQDVAEWETALKQAPITNVSFHGQLPAFHEVGFGYDYSHDPAGFGIPFWTYSARGPINTYGDTVSRLHLSLH